MNYFRGVIWIPSSPVSLGAFFPLFSHPLLPFAFSSLFLSISFSFLNLQPFFFPLLPSLPPSSKHLNAFKCLFYIKIKKPLLNLLPLHPGPI